MRQMYCPQCGRELELDSGEIRFCRYCGFALLDTKDALHGYSEQKRMGFSIVTWSYALLLIVALLLHGKYVSLDTDWVYWLLSIVIVLSVSFFVSAAVSALKPALFTKTMRRDQSALEPKANGGNLRRSQSRETSLLTPPREPAAEPMNHSESRERAKPRSVIEGTTKRLNDHSSSGSEERF